MREVQLRGLKDGQQVLPLHLLDESLQDLLLGRFAQRLVALVLLRTGGLSRGQREGPWNVRQRPVLAEDLPELLWGQTRWSVPRLGAVPRCTGSCCPLLFLRSHGDSFHVCFGERLGQDLLQRDALALEQLGDQRVVGRNAGAHSGQGPTGRRFKAGRY